MSYNPNNPNGSATSANSAPVVIASDQASLPLPTGASTAAKQPAFGVAGTPSSDVVTVQGSASGTPQPISGTITANAGTNLNTSALALDATLTGGTAKFIAAGDIASGATDSGNPVKVGGKYNSSAPSLTTGQRSDIQMTSGGNLKITLYDVTGVNNLTNQTDTNGDSAGAAIFQLGVSNRNWLFNGTNFDRQRANYNTATGDTGAKTTTFNGATQTNYNAKGATIVLNIGTVSGTTPTLTAQVQGSADGGTTWYSIPGGVTPSITATGTTALTVYPGTTVAANAAVSYPLPRTWRLLYTIGGTTPSFTITNVQIAYVL